MIPSLAFSLHLRFSCAMWLTALIENWHTNSCTPLRLSSSKEGRVTGTIFTPEYFSGGFSTSVNSFLTSANFFFQRLAAAAAAG